MPIITKISVQQKRKDRYNIFLDYGKGKGEEYAFSVDEDVLIKHNLKKGLEIDDFFMSELSYSDDIRKAYNTAINYLARMMRSEKEVRSHLKEKEFDETAIQEAIHKLYEFTFLNDEELAFAYVRTQINTSDKGPNAIKRELKEKGVAVPFIEAALGEYDPGTELEKAVHLCEKYMQKNSRESQKVLKQKLEQLLYRKGYRSSVAQQAIAELEFQGDDEEYKALCVQAEKLARKYSKFSGYEFNAKMKTALYRKGFPLEQIDRYMGSLDG